MIAMPTSFLITGASGNVGKAVLDSLPQTEWQRIYKTTRHQPINTEGERWFDLEQPDSFASSLQQIDVVFLLRPPQLTDVSTYFVPFLTACQQASIKHIVFLSVQGAEDTSFIPHYKIETLIRESGIGYTFIRPSYFMQNLTTTLRNDIVAHHRLFLPAGNAPFLWVDVVDIGRAIGVVLTHWEYHKNKSYTITGPELLNFNQVSTLLSQRLGYSVRYESLNLIRFFLIKRREGLSRGLILVMILLHVLPRFQKSPPISPDFTYLMGEQPNTLARFIDYHKSEWL